MTEPFFTEEHVRAFHRRTSGARNQGLPTRPYTQNKDICSPPRHIPQPNPFETAEYQLRTSKASNPKMSDWVFNNRISVALSCTVISISIIPLVLIAYKWSFEWGWKHSPFVRFLNLFTTLSLDGACLNDVWKAISPLSDYFDSYWWGLVTLGQFVMFAATLKAIGSTVMFFVNSSLLGMERYIKAETKQADERRWLGEISP